MKKTNDMHITFNAENKNDLKYIYPVTYEEAMLYLDAKKRLKEFNELTTNSFY